MRSSSILFIIGSVFLVGCATTSTDTPVSSSSSSVSSVATSSAASSVADLQGETVDYGEANGYLSLPEGAGPHPAIVLIHEWWGLNRDWSIVEEDRRVVAMLR
jgi:carboxymethylenebutenolidase